MIINFLTKKLNSRMKKNFIEQTNRMLDADEITPANTVTAYYDYLKLFKNDQLKSVDDVTFETVCTEFGLTANMFHQHVKAINYNTDHYHQESNKLCDRTSYIVYVSDWLVGVVGKGQVKFSPEHVKSVLINTDLQAIVNWLENDNLPYTPKYLCLEIVRLLNMLARADYGQQ